MRCESDQTRLGTLPVSLSMGTMILCPTSAVRPDMHGQPPYPRDRSGSPSATGRTAHCRVDVRRARMSAKKENATFVGVGVAACAACCAGPILGVLAAIGLGTAGGFLAVGTVALFVGAAVVALVVLRRRRRSRASR